MGRRRLEPLMFLVWGDLQSPAFATRLPTLEHARKDSNLNLAVLETAALLLNYTPTLLLLDGRAVCTHRVSALPV